MTAGSMLAAAVAVVVTIRTQSAQVGVAISRLSKLVDRLDDTFSDHEKKIAVIETRLAYQDLDKTGPITVKPQS